MTDFESFPFESCANCETPFHQDVSYPAVTRQENGDIDLYSFCDEECREASAADD